MTTPSERRPPQNPSPARIPPHASTPRWHGDPEQRPLTDAETARRHLRHRSLGRFVSLSLGIALVAFVLSPMPLLHALYATVAAHGPMARLAARIGFWLTQIYPLLRSALLILLTLLLIHLVVGLVLITIQYRRRLWQQSFTTVHVDLIKSASVALGSGVDLFAAIGTLLSAAGSLAGREDSLVFALVNHADDHRVRLALRGATATPAARATFQAACSLLSGVIPHATIRPADDELSAALATGAPSSVPDGSVVGSADFVLQRSPAYPLKDLARFVGSDPLGPLAAALDRIDGVRTTAIEIILRALPHQDDWRTPLRAQIGLIEGSVNPEDRASYDALLRKVDATGVDVVIRCIVIADDRATALRQLRILHHALRTFTQPTGTTRQALHPRGAWLPHRHAGFTLTPLNPCTTGSDPASLPAWNWRQTGIAYPVIGMLLGGIGAGILGFTLPMLQHALAGTLALPMIALPIPLQHARIPLLTGATILAGALGALAMHPRLRAARARTHLALLRSHAHQSVWPAAAWTFVPAPGRRRSILAPYELAALWHVPSSDLDAPFAWRTARSFPAPEAAFLRPSEAQDAEQRRVIPRQPTPQALGACRLGLAYARRRSGDLALIGPTLRDLRQGWDTMGGTGSGKSSLIETMVVEIARIGGGCGVIDAKGDLADRLLRVLPREAYDRVVVIDTTATILPCINPFDRRIIGAKPRDVVAGEIGEIFARIEPEIWAGAIGMQQALLMSISAILEGEAEPSLLHLQRFLLSPAYRSVVLSRVVDRTIRDYWLKQVPQMPEKIKVSIESLKRRIDMLIGSETGQRLLCQPRSTIDLGAIIRQQGILIIKFVPERIGHTNAAYWSAVIFQSIISATFQQQTERDPEQRWDWPLFVDEVQMFVKSERADDAERMWTRTRSMGVGLIGAHQGLNQLGEKLGGIVLNVIGGLCLTSGVRDDARGFVDAFANQGVQVADVTGIKAREELLIRFPVAGRDMGLISAVPRERPTEQPAPAHLHRRQLANYHPHPYQPSTSPPTSSPPPPSNDRPHQPALPDQQPVCASERADGALPLPLAPVIASSPASDLLRALEQGVTEFLAAAAATAGRSITNDGGNGGNGGDDSDGTNDGVDIVEHDHDERPEEPEPMGAESVYRVIANRWLDELIPMVMTEAEAALIHQTGERSLLESQRHTLAWAAIHALIHDLRDASTRRAHGQAEALMTTGADQPMAADTYLTQVSNERYGVHPLINACFAAALVRQYEPEALGTNHPERRQKRPPAGEAGKAPRQISPITHGQHAAQEKGTEQETEKGTEAAFPGWKVVA